jgi:hypothetical protein
LICISKILRNFTKISRFQTKTHIIMETTNFNQFQQPMPPTYLWQSIVVTILCCLPLGIPGIVYASQVENRWRSGDIDGAMRSSNNAKNFTLWGFIIGIVVGLGYIIFYGLVLAGLLGGGMAAALGM